ncbi:MAG: response regulator [Candidatus Heimdallarchaeaceae archaeon]
METILIVDDNEDLRSLFRLMLQTHYEIVEASDGLEAISVFKEQKPALTLMDIVMPEMNGIEATREIKKISPEAKIIAITAYSTGIQDILDAGAFLVRQKPIRKIFSN